MDAEKIAVMLNAVEPEGHWACEAGPDGVVVACDMPGVEGRFGKRIEGEPDPECLAALLATWRYQAQYGSG